MSATRLCLSSASLSRITAHHYKAALSTSAVLAGPDKSRGHYKRPESQGQSRPQKARPFAGLQHPDQARGWKKDRMNTFAGNIGAARQIRQLGLDVDDPVLNSENFQDGFGIEQSLEERSDESKAFRKQWKVDQDHQKILAKRKMVQKNMFPKTPYPNLLTWLEKEMIRYLHKQDPVEWSKVKLSESFPATVGVIHKVLRGKTLNNPDRVAAYNREVTANWKLLAKGQLELSREYREHLAASDSSGGLTHGQRQLAEQEILVEVDKRTAALPRPEVPGPWASIVRDYREKTEVREDDLPFIPGGLFGHNTIPGETATDEVSPYRDTALVRTDIDLAREQPMDIALFKKTYLSEKDLKGGQSEEENPYRRQYLAWVRGQEVRDHRAAKSVPKLEVSEVEVPEPRVAKWRSHSEDNVAKWRSHSEDRSQPFGDIRTPSDKVATQASRPADRVAAYFRQKEESRTLVPDMGRLTEQEPPSREVEARRDDVYVHPPSSPLSFRPLGPDVVEIPAELGGRGYSQFRVGGDCYDREGQLMYRVPGENWV